MATVKAIERSAVHRICSGQVILDLATGVKELIENSLDAGATNIEIRLKQYGADLFEVADNGSGVSPENYAALTLKYHTSKLSEFTDLEALSTFGFRGEALSSLCSLGEVSVVTRTREEAVGTRLEFDPYGELVSSQPAPRAVGTTVAVANLFKPLPVRYQELHRNIKREYAKLQTMVQAYAIIATGVRIICTNQAGAGGRTTVVSSPGLSTIKEHIVTVLGSKVMDAMQPLEGTVMEGTSFSGFITKATAGSGKAGGDRQFFYLNGRPVDLPKVARLINEAYRTLSSSSSATARPMAVIDFELPKDSFDINVTADKRKVMLHHEKAILDGLQQALQKLWDASRFSYGVSDVLKVTQADTPRPVKRLKAAAASQPSPSTPQSSSDGDDYSEAERASERTPSESLVGWESQEQSDDPAASGSEPRCSSPVDVTPLPPSRQQAARAEAALAFQRPRSKMATPASAPRLSNFAQGSQKTPYVPSRLARNDPKQMLLRGFLTKQSSRKSGAAEGAGTMEAGCSASIPPILDTVALTSAASNPRDQSNAPLHAGTKEAVLGDREQQESPSAQMENAALEQRQLGDEFGCSEDSENLLKLNASLLQKEGLSAVQAAPTSENAEAVLHDTSHPATLLPSAEIPANATSQAQLHDELLRSGPELASVQAAPGRQPENYGISTQEETAFDAMFGDTERPLGPAAPSAAQEDLVLPFDWDAIRQAWEKMAADLAASEAEAVQSAPDTATNAMPKSAFAAASLEAAAEAEAAGVSREDADKAAQSELERIIHKEDFLAMEIIGQFNLGFIITKLRGDMFIIDQHAADEKYNFERLQRVTVLNRQPLVHPQRLDLSPMEVLSIRENLEVFQKNGFDFVDGADESLCLSAVPFSKNITFGHEDVQELIALINEGTAMPMAMSSMQAPKSGITDSVVRPSRVRAMLASRACRSSIMVGKALDRRTMQLILTHLAELDSPWNCPHGRPTMRHLAVLPKKPHSVLPSWLPKEELDEMRDMLQKLFLQPSAEPNN